MCIFSHFCGPLKNTVSTDVFCASGAQNHGIYDVFFFLHLVATIMVFTMFFFCFFFFLPLPGKNTDSKNTDIYVVFSMLQDVVFLYAKRTRKEHCILRCFCFPSAAKKSEK